MLKQVCGALLFLSDLLTADFVHVAPSESEFPLLGSAREVVCKISIVEGILLC